jgi:hypothetical protein
MIKRNLIVPAFILFCLLPVSAQVTKQETGFKREVTLYNPYKPSLPEVKKRSFLPDMNDTMKIRPEFLYDIMAKPFLPVYTIIPIKAVALLPDPLPKLYKSYVNIGMGNYSTPLAEISITNERSKKGAIGFYGRHFSSNGNVELQNGKKVFAGYMDNDASLFGRKFFRKNLFESSVDFSQKIRYAYGYDTSIINYSPAKKDIRRGYDNIGAKVSLSSLTLDSTSLSYDFDIFYNFFSTTGKRYQHNAGIKGMMAKSYKGFYIGSGIDYEFFKHPDSYFNESGFGIASISPFIRKSTEQWSFKLGFQALLDEYLGSAPVFHIYPDVNLGINLVPKYISFFAGLSGKLEKNDPMKLFSENPYLKSDEFLFTMQNTDHKLIVSSGLKGNSGLGGNYLASVTYSMIDNMLFYYNLDYPFMTMMGNYFDPAGDDVELLQIHGELNGIITDKISYTGNVNWYKYTLSNNDFAWNKPDWDAKLGLKYNLRDKILFGMELTGIGSRMMGVINDDFFKVPPVYKFEMPVHINLNLTAEYRYSKILSFWTRLDNISYNRYYEWAYYPSQKFLCMLGFTYSL